MNNKTIILVLSSVLIAAAVLGCMKGMADYGITANQTPVEVHDPFGM